MVSLTFASWNRIREWLRRLTRFDAWHEHGLELVPRTNRGAGARVAGMPDHQIPGTSRFVLAL
jgi:hypothetical protein